jgi:hypothetical protein
MRTRRLLAVLALSVAALALPVVASGDIAATTGEVHKAPPPNSVVLGQHEHDDDTGNPSGAHAFNEEQDYVTKAPIALDVCTTNASAFVVCASRERGEMISVATGDPDRRSGRRSG